MDRQQSGADRLIHQFDTVLRTLAPHATSPQRVSPAKDVTGERLDDHERRHVAGLMRIHHTGEVCLQGLYQGQGITAQLPHARKQMEQSTLEKIDHLAWCDERLEQLHSRASYLNPLFYITGFGVGAATGAVSDRVSLGFLAAAEEQAGKSLDLHQQSLPESDACSRAILRQMAIDAAHQSHIALEAGGLRFPGPIRWLMHLGAKMVTKGVHHS
ncbi:MAG: 2-polyprenyl-3-methyl-6-methoxy-1,4-benzoquinone monooxygenase [Halomonas sp.]|uniref:2-polyprenyl-3-methyl-6-methoxy-1,4-benzoquinone monooxygenase n=1 Tax=Halomonas sp. TaxID=1486246 RepID=UPI003F92D351